MGSYSESIIDKKVPAVFPKALDVFERKPIVNEFGLTSTEIKSLQNGWAIIKRKQRQAGINIYVNLFTEHDELYELFRSDNGVLNIQFAGQHQKDVLNVFQMVIEQLENIRFVRTLLKEVAGKHRDVGVTSYQWQMYTDEVKQYFVATLKDFSSPTFLRALDTLMDHVCQFNQLEGLKEINLYEDKNHKMII